MSRVASIELLRFVSALMVLIWHYQQFYLPYNPFSFSEISQINIQEQPFYNILSFFYNFGNRGVDFFFIISGYVFAYVYLSNKARSDFKTFFINRFARLYPLHLITLLTVLFLQLYSKENFKTDLIYFFNDIYHFILNLLFISGWGLEKGPSFNGPVWSVSIEIIIYILFFFSLLNFQKFRFQKTLLITIIFILIRKFLSDDYLILLPKYLLDCAILFYEGVLVYFLAKTIKNQFLLLAFGILLYFLSIIGNFKMYIFFPSILLILIFFENYLNKYLSSIFCFLGNLTYGTYLWHVPIQMIIIIIIKKYNFDFSIINSNIFFIAYLTFVFTVSTVSYHFLEKKIRGYIRRKFNS